MLDTFKSLTVSQFEAALSTLHVCVQHCPSQAWDAPVANLKFCQVAFHTLFFTDFYLSENEAAFLEQPFHKEHTSDFRDYEEMQPRKQVLLYSRPFVVDYLIHCRDKAGKVLTAESEEVLTAPCQFPGRNFSRAELHVYSVRHVQHHVAQLSLRLRLDAKIDVPWIGHGWHDTV